MGEELPSAPDPDSGGTWCGTSEAARRLGISERAVRNRMRRGVLEWRPRGNHGREVLVPPGAAPGAEQDPDREDSVDLLVLVARLQERLAASELREAELRAR